MTSNPNIPGSLSAQARLRRLRKFAACLRTAGLSGARLLDIGGKIEYWQPHLACFDGGLVASIEVVNLPGKPETSFEVDGILIKSHTGDALDPSTLDSDDYDVVHSNSVIEHVGNLRAQLRMARLMRELGRYYWVQSPARSFPVEPHFYVPYFPLLPLGLRTWLHQHFKTGWMGREPDWLQARLDCEETRLPTRRELAVLFPDGSFIPERLYGLCKSHIVTNLPLGPEGARL